MVTHSQTPPLSLAVIRRLLSLFVLSSLLFASVSSIADAANITVSTSRNPVSLDDSFHLYYEADSSVDDDPDFSPIYENFDVLSSSQSTNMRSINGSWSLKKTWDLAIIAKDIGKFTIPAIHFGSDISPAIQVTVLSSSSANSVSPKGQSTVPAKIFMEASIDKASGYVQSQFIYTIRLLRTVSLVGASITDPVVTDADAIIKQIGEDNYSTKRNGISYEVFERRYAIFPQKSGKLKVNPLTFEGRVNASQPRTIFDQFRMSGQLKRLRSKAVEFEVKPAPATIKLQDWLPTSRLQLIDQWSDDIENIKTGEPITRTITISAEGLTGVQLPDLSFDDIEGIKQYPDKAVVEDQETSSGITGVKQIKVALIPGRAGRYSLPEIRIGWWNTQTDKLESSTIPATSINVIGPVTEVAPVATPPQTSVEQPVPSAAPKVVQETRGEDESILWKVLTASFAMAWLLTLLLYLRKPSAPASTRASYDAASPIDLKPAINAVRKYAKQNDARNTRDALIKWAQANYADATLSNLNQLTKRCSTALATEIGRLNRCLYGADHQNWQGDALLSAFDDELSSRPRPAESGQLALKPLYRT